MVRRALVPLRVVVVIGLVLLAGVCWWTWQSVQTASPDGRKTIVFWGSEALGDDIYGVVNSFEKENPRYRVLLGNSMARDPTGDAQRLLCAIAGDVPPDLVWIDRFAIGEWAGRKALTDLTPYLDQQRPDDPDRINLADYYPWTVKEASYHRPGDPGSAHIFGIPTSVDIRVLYCNADLLRQEGLVDAQGRPKPPKTWEELRAYANRLTRYRIPGDHHSGITRLGFAPNFGNSWLYLYAWEAGGEMLSPDGRKITMDSPPVVRALRFMTDIYDDLGGAAQVDGFQQSFQSDALDPFVRGQVAMKIDGDWSLATIANWRPDMDFTVTPAPMPADQLALGRDPVTWAGGWALVIPSSAHHPKGAFRLLQYLRSWKVTKRLEQGKREMLHSEGRMYLPSGNPDRVFYKRIVDASITSDPDIGADFKAAYTVLAALMPHTLIRPVTPVGQLLWNQHVRAYQDATSHTFAAEARATGKDECELALANAQKPVQRQLDAILDPPPGGVVDWTPYLVAYALVTIAALGAIIIATLRNRSRYRPAEVAAALGFASPWLIGFVVLVGGPIIFSIVFSFTRYDVLSRAHYLGLANYREVFTSHDFVVSLRNTAFMLIRIPLSMVASLAIALLLNRSIRGIGLYRTAFYLPSIMPLVAASLLWIWLFNPNQGAIDQVLRLFVNNPPDWLQDKHWSKPALILMNLWSCGGGMIIWLAGLQSIPQHLYEAASIDGAGPWRRFWNITLPMLSPYVLFNLIVGLIGTMQIFSEAYIMTAGGPADSTLFYAYYLFREAFQFFRIGYASALAWILFVVILILTLVQLWLSRMWVNYDQ